MHWQTVDNLWGGQNMHAAPFKVARHLEFGAPLLLTHGDEVAVATLFGQHLGYLSQATTIEVNRRHAAGELILARVVKPATASGPLSDRRVTKIRVLVWSEYPPIYDYEVVCDQRNV